MSTQTDTLLQFSAASNQETVVRSQVKTRHFSFVVDEPQELGGTDEAPNPVEYLLGAYAGCLQIVANLVAKEQGIDPGNLRINVSGDLDPARFLSGSTGARAGFQSVKVDISSSKPLSEKDKARLLTAITDRCPINDTIRNATPVSITLK